MSAKVFEKARKHAYQLWVDFGAEIGIKQSFANIVDHYQPDELQGKRVVVVVYLPPRQIADFQSEFLVLGTYCQGGVVRLLLTNRQKTTMSWCKSRMIYSPIGAHPP